MELKVNAVAIPEQISFNYDELKSELLSKVQLYETIVYTEDQVKEAKADKASLTKLKKALNDERIRREREYMKPFNEFKAQVNEIIAIIDKPISVIDKQVREFEENRKAEKMREILEYINAQDIPEGIDTDLMINPKWLNASVSMKQVKAEINELLQTMYDDLLRLEEMPEFSFEAVLKYKQTLDLRAALSEAKRLSDMQQLKAMQDTSYQDLNKMKAEAKKSTTEVQKGAWVSFRAFLTANQAAELKSFFDSRNIRFQRG